MREVQTGFAEEVRKDEIRRIFSLQRANQFKMGNRSARERIELLKSLKHEILARRKDIREAIYSDFRKAPLEVDATEIYPVIKDIKYAIRHLKSWMRPIRVRTPLVHMGTVSHIWHEPKGVALIIAPWNFPVNLILSPLVDALAAGNCAVLKPSEVTPNSARVLEEIITKVFRPEDVAIFRGGIPTSQFLLDLPFNHIFFTGSTEVGRVVMEKAAQHHASFTLELGGKSPVIVLSDANIKRAARRIAWGKYLNSGQICLAPDYVLVPKSISEMFCAEVRKNITRFYGENPENSPDYNRIAAVRHFDRLQGYLHESLDNGSMIDGGRTNRKDLYIEPTIIQKPGNGSKLMNEEIFGPLLPIIEYENLSEAIELVNSKPKPLALYIFGRSSEKVRMVLKNTRAGTTVINHNVLHFSQPNLPFGGVNQSGIGKARGYFGFQEFSNARPVYNQKFRYAISDLILPPFNRAKQVLIDFVLKYF